MPGAKSNRSSPTPWVSVAALLAASFATMAGLVRGIDPEVILWRAVVAATLVGALAAVAGCLAHSVRNRVSEK